MLNLLSTNFSGCNNSFTTYTGLYYTGVFYFMVLFILEMIFACYDQRQDDLNSTKTKEEEDKVLSRLAKNLKCVIRDVE